MSIDRTLKDEIKSELEDLKNLELGTEEHKTAVDSIAKLMDKAIEMDKFDVETEERNRNRLVDDQLKREQFEAEKKDRLIKNLITIGTCVITTGLAAWGTFEAFEFEKTGTITTLIGKSYINKLFPKK